VTPEFIRLSVGLETVDDLIANLDPGKLLCGQRKMYFNNGMTADTNQVLMLFVSTDPIVMSPVNKINPVEDLHRDEHLYRTIQRRTSQVWLSLSQIMPQIIYRKDLSGCSKLDKPLGNELSLPCITSPRLAENGAYLVCPIYRHRCFLIPAGRRVGSIKTSLNIMSSYTHLNDT
jgi:hypothetical protein